MKNYLTRNDRNDYVDFWGDMFDDFFKPFYVSDKTDNMKTDIKEKDKNYEMNVELAGFDKEDIDLKLEGGYLTISANKKENTGDKYLRRERRMSYARSYYVGENLTEDDITAKYQNGLLTIEIPKKEEKIETAKRISIQ